MYLLLKSVFAFSVFILSVIVSIFLMNTRNLEFFEEEKIYRHSPQLKSTDKSSEIKKKRLIIERLPTPEERAHAKIRDQFRGSTLDAILDMSKYATGTVGFDCVYGISLN